MLPFVLYITQIIVPPAPAPLHPLQEPVPLVSSVSLPTEPGVMKMFQVAQQVDERYVSWEPGIVTQFAPAARSGVIGLLAHREYAGEHIAMLKPGDQVKVIIDNVTWIYEIQYSEVYEVTPNEMYVSVETGVAYNTAGLYARVFEDEQPGYNRVVLQTCEEKFGKPTWGRRFVFGKRVE